MRMPFDRQRISWPPSVTSMIWSASSTGKEATSWPIFSLIVSEPFLPSQIAMATMPLPPRPVIAVLVGRGALAVAALGDGQDELLGRRHLDIALLAQARSCSAPLASSASSRSLLVLAVGRGARALARLR